MHTVIANRQIVGLVSRGSPQPDSGTDLEGGEDFAALISGEGAEKGPSEDIARSEAAESSGLVAAAYWPGVTLLTGCDGAWAMAGQLQSDGVQAPFSGSGLTPDLKVAPVAAAGQTAMPSSGAVPLDVDDARLASGAHALIMGSLPDQTLDLDPAAAHKILAYKDIAPDALDDAVGGASMSGALQSTAAVASVGLRLWPDARAQDNGPPTGKDGLSVPPATAPLAGTSAILTAPNMPSGATTVPAAVLVAKFAETALLSLFTAQADAASLDQVEGAVGFAPGGTASAFVSASSMSGPVAVPQLAAHLVHILAHNSNGTTQIALSPDELGHVRVTLQADPQNPDRLIVMLNFERPETLDLFRRHADQLAEALHDAGFAGADIGFGHSGSGGNSDHQPEGALADRRAAQDLAPGLTLSPAADLPALRVAASSALDLRL